MTTAEEAAAPTTEAPDGTTTAELTAAATPDRRTEMPASPPILYRDPADVRTLFQLLTALLGLVLLLGLSALGNAWQYWRRPDRIVVDRSSGRVLVLNDRQFGETDAVQLTTDQPGEADKRYLAGEYTRLLYGINPSTRAADLKAALEMMTPQSAAKFAAYLKEQHLLEQQRAEAWQAVWTVQDAALDRLDPFTLRLIGRQELTRLRNQQVVQESKQLQLTLKLVADPAGRNDANRRSGFLVAWLDAKELHP
jgi:hypothetical protein